MKVLSTENFSGHLCRVFCLSNENSTWTISKKFETSQDEECGQFFQDHKDHFFILVLSPCGDEATFHGKQLSILCRAYEGQLRVYDFEDLKPNEDFQNFEKVELKQGMAYLKNLLQGD